jgi:anti-sigma B factor antagonist
MENTIKISVSESGQDDRISLIRVDGVIDTLTAVQLEEVLDKMIKRERFFIVLDLAGVDYISSAGWGIFISRIKEVREKGGDIKLANMVPNVMEVYELLEFDNILSAYDDIKNARGAFGTGTPESPLKKKADRRRKNDN